MKIADKLEKHRCPNCGSLNVRNKGYRNNGIGQKAKAQCNDCGKGFSYEINSKNKPRRIVVISDTHSGHITGLTPPSHDTSIDKFSDFRKEAWRWYSDTMLRLQPIDILIANGDLIDGRQDKNGGSELITPDRFKQVNMAVDCLKEAKADKIYISRGTPYHSGRLEDWENNIAEKTDAEIENIIKIEVNGCKINARHKTGRSTIPHGRSTNLSLQCLWEDLKIAGTDEGKVNILIRSHVHYTTFMGNGNNRFAFTTPALQGASNFGEKECVGIVDFGLTVIDIDKNGMFQHKFILKKFDEGNKYKSVYSEE